MSRWLHSRTFVIPYIITFQFLRVSLKNFYVKFDPLMWPHLTPKKIILETQKHDHHYTLCNKLCKGIKKRFSLFLDYGLYKLLKILEKKKNCSIEILEKYFDRFSICKYTCVSIHGSWYRRTWLHTI